MPDPPPRIATPRSTAATFGPRVARISAAVAGRPFMPWQRAAADLIGEHDGSGRRIHPFVVVTVQRQAGKTDLVMDLAIERCLLDGPERRVWYTAQTGQYAREKWAEIATQLCAPGSPLAGYVAAKWTNGSEKLTFPNGSTFRPFPPTRDALHSMQSDLVIVDEGWRHDPVRGAELLQAIGPTQATRPGAQVAILSTQGTSESTWFHGLVDRGRAGDPAVTFLEWGLGDDGDPTDLDLVAAAHPAVGHTIDRSYLEAQAAVLKDQPGEFARAYANVRTGTYAGRFIDRNLWKAAATSDPLPAGPVVFAADIAQDRSRSAIVACAGGILEVIESRPGTDWPAARILGLRDKWHPAGIVVDRVGPSGTLHDELDRAGIDLYPLTAAEYATACPRFMDDLDSGAVHYRPDGNLDQAADDATPRPLGDGWAWGRRRSGGPIPEIVAATLASWVHLHRPAPPARPRIVTAGR